MVQITQQLVSSRSKTNGEGNPVDFITVHETANQSQGAGAQAHANLQSKGNVRSASWHYSCDDKLVIQSYPDDVRCWHGGTGTANNRSLAIEICVNPDSDFAGAVVNAAALVRQKMAEHQVPLSRVVRHQYWTGKNCPTRLIGGSYGISWDAFLALVVSGAEPLRPSQGARLVVDGRWGPSTARWMQKIMGTHADGVISHQLRGRANENIYAAQFDATRKGSDLGRAIQWRLQSLGQYPGAIDGLIGPGTVVALQRHWSTPQDGVISPESLLVAEIQRGINGGSFLGVAG